ARGGAGHAVGDDQQRPPLTHVVRAHRRLQRRLAAGEIGHEETVLVVVARLAEVGLGEDLDLDGLGGAPEHQGDKSPFSSLTSFWYVVLSGARTKAAAPAGRARRTASPRQRAAGPPASCPGGPGSRRGGRGRTPSSRPRPRPGRGRRPR